MPPAKSPRKQERNLKIEDDEQDRHQVEPDIELTTRIVKRRETAFVGRYFLGIRLLPGDDIGGRHDNERQPRGDRQKNQYGKVLPE